MKNNRGWVFHQSKVENLNTERRQSSSFTFIICDESEASIHKLDNARGYFEGSRQYVLSYEKSTPLTNSKQDLLTKIIVTHKHDKSNSLS